MKSIKRGRLVVFIGYGPRSQRSIRRLSLMIEKLKEYFEVSLVHVPDDAVDDLPYIRIEPFNHTETPPMEIDLLCEFESKI